MLITSKNIFTETCRIVSDQVSGYHAPSRSPTRHVKINHHGPSAQFYCHLLTPAPNSYPSSTLLSAEFPHPSKPEDVEGHLQECSSLPAFPAPCSATRNSPTVSHHTVASLSLSHSMLLWPDSSFQTSPGEPWTLGSMFIEDPKLPGIHSKLQRTFLAHAPLL